MANITFLEAGGASTGGTELFDAINGSWTVDTTIKPAGAYSAFRHELVVGNYFLRASVLQDASRTSFYYRTSALPQTKTVLKISTTTGGLMSKLSLRTSGVLRYEDGLNNPTDGTAVLATNTWYRITLSFDSHGTSDNLDVKVYLNGVQDISVSAQSTAGRSNPVRAEFYVDSGADNFGDYSWFAHIYVDDGSDLSDPGNIQCTAKFPTSVNVGNFDTTGGTGAVNERPLSETNYMEQAGASQVNQNYNLQNSSTGDVNISGTLVGYMGWLWAKESAVSGTPKLTLNGSDYAVTLTTSPAIYRKPITSASYPSNAATIGMVSSGTTDDTFLYECGVVVGFIPAAIGNPGRLRTIWLAGK